MNSRISTARAPSPEFSELGAFLDALQTVFDVLQAGNWQQVRAIETAVLARSLKADDIDVLAPSYRGLAWLVETTLEGAHLLVTPRKVVWLNRAASESFARVKGLRPLVVGWAQELLASSPERSTVSATVCEGRLHVDGQLRVIRGERAHALGAVRFSLRDRLDDRSPLTPAEKRVLAHLAKGASNKEIAQTHDVSVETVKTQVRCIMQKLRVNSRVKAALWAHENLGAPDALAPKSDKAVGRRGLRAVPPNGVVS